MEDDESSGTEEEENAKNKNMFVNYNLKEGQITLRVKDLEE